MSVDESAPFDPKLRKAMREIRVVMDKHDIGGFVGLFSQSHAEFLNHIEPTWSMARYKRDEQGNPIGIRLKVRKKLRERSEATVGMFANMRDLAAMFFGHADGFIKEISKVLEIEHVPFNGGISTEGLVPPNASIVSFPGGKAKED